MTAAARRRDFTTPEGVDLHLTLAEASERASAFLIDLIVIVVLLIAITLIAGLLALGFHGARQFAGVIWLLGFFLLRNFYFVAGELRPAGATFGKRRLGLRVVARDGGRLTADAVFVRNLMREIEVFLPLTFIAARGDDVDVWLAVAGLGWTGIFLLFPLFNQDRLRVGDLLAGTWVVRAPRRNLVRDLSERTQPDGRFVFTPAQIDVYGIKELHVLEDVLRRRQPSVSRVVAERIQRKIGWTPAAGETPDSFLDAYYTALRRRLETKLLFGQRRVDKFDQS